MRAGGEIGENFLPVKIFSYTVYTIITRIVLLQASPGYSQYMMSCGIVKLSMGIEFRTSLQSKCKVHKG